MRSSNQKERLQKLREGEGTFVYDGGFFDTESVPGIPALGKDGNQLRQVILKTVETDDGKSVQVIDPDASGKGALVWKRAPRFFRKELEVLRLRIPGVFAEHVESGDDPKRPNERKPSLKAASDVKGKAPALFLELPKGKPVFVGDPRLALKLRCMGQVREVLKTKDEPKKTKDEPSKLGE
jgi:hypothetical protein